MLLRTQFTPSDDATDTNIDDAADSADAGSDDDAYSHYEIERIDHSDDVGHDIQQPAERVSSQCSKSSISLHLH